MALKARVSSLVAFLHSQATTAFLELLYVLRYRYGSGQRQRQIFVVVVSVQAGTQLSVLLVLRTALQ